MGQMIMPPLPPENSPNYERELLAQIAYLEKELLIQLWMKAGLAIGVVLLVIAFSMKAAHAGTTEILKSQSCDTVPVRVVEAEPDVIVIGQPVNIFYAQAQARKLLKELKLKQPCELKGRVRSRADLKCYLPDRMP